MKIRQANSQISAELDALNLLTDKCRAAVAADDPLLLQQLMASRQDCIDRLDAMRTAEHDFSDEERQKLIQLQVKDQALSHEAETLNDQYRQALKSIRSHRFIQAYARDPDLSSRFLDIRE